MFNTKKLNLYLKKCLLLFFFKSEDGKRLVGVHTCATYILNPSDKRTMTASIKSNFLENIRLKIVNLMALRWTSLFQIFFSSSEVFEKPCLHWGTLYWAVVFQSMRLEKLGYLNRRDRRSCKHTNACLLQAQRLRKEIWTKGGGGSHPSPSKVHIF